MKNLLLTLIAIMLATGCAKKKSISPEGVINNSHNTVGTELIEVDNTVEIPIEVEVVETESMNIDSGNTKEPETKVINSEPVVEELPEPVEPSEPQVTINKKLDLDQLFPDSVWTDYMTKRGDYLSLIAYKEYSNANEWRRIYDWNKEHWEELGIGPDKDNPNFIYPYRELDLKKPAENAIEWAYDHYIHEVVDGESLWTISKKEYGDELAWVVLFWDNEKIIENHDGKLLPGMELKIRSELWPELD